jgi:hypothetical protein
MHYRLLHYLVLFLLVINSVLLCFNFLADKQNKQTNSVALSPRANYTD